ncbi:MAG: CBS domain-containing protein [Lachnospiraceae bacterium]|nr:CBS domain-containing protein [Lachnospiraceae bacterium]
MEKYCVSENYTIKEVLAQFESANDRVAIVLNGNKKVVGVVSQGDIIRALSAGMSIYEKVSQIIQSSFLHLYEKNMEKAYEIFKKKKISLLPIIDKNGYLSDVITNSDIYIYLENK